MTVAELITFYSVSAVFGGCLGWFSYVHQTLFAGVVGVSGVSTLALMETKVIEGLSDIDALVAGAPISDSAMLVALGALIFMMVLGRAWAWSNMRRPERREDPARRRARILADYGIKDPLAGVKRGRGDSFVVQGLQRSAAPVYRAAQQPVATVPAREETPLQARLRRI